MDRLAYNVKKADLGDLVQNAEESGAPNGPAASSTSSLVPESSGDASNPGLSGNHIQFDPWDENVFISSTVTTITLKYKINSGVQLNYMLWESWRDGEFSTIANANFKQAKEAAVEEPFQKGKCGNSQDNAHGSADKLLPMQLRLNMLFSTSLSLRMKIA